MADRPNIVFMHLDQWHHGAVSALGNPYVKTPCTDALLKESYSFERSYSSNPVCCPARTCWYTGLPSCEHGTIINNVPLEPYVPIIAASMKDAGYVCAYAGKWHIMRPPTGYFDILDRGYHIGESGDASVVKSAMAFLNSYDGARPFFLNIGLLNPHDCCYLGMGAAKGCPTKVGALARMNGKIPPLPPSYEFENSGVKMSDWPRQERRLYLYDYYRFVERAEALVGDVLGTLKNSKFADNTIFILSADHGDMLLERGDIGKSRPYDAAAKVPLIVWGAGVSKGVKDSESPVTSIDVAASIVDFAGVGRHKHMGKYANSFKNKITGGDYTAQKYVVNEVFPDSKKLIRSVISKDRKYIFDYQTRNIEVYDISGADYYEMKNLVKESAEARGLQDAICFLNDFGGNVKYSAIIKKSGRVEDYKNFTPANV